MNFFLKRSFLLESAAAEVLVQNFQVAGPKFQAFGLRFELPKFQAFGLHFAIHSPRFQLDSAL